MLYALLGAVLAVIGVLGRNYTIQGIGSCFALDVFDWDVCFSYSIIPKLMEYGSLALGAMLLAIAACKMPPLRRPG